MFFLFCFFELMFFINGSLFSVSKYETIFLIIFKTYKDLALHNKLVEHVNCSQCKERELMPQASYRSAPLRCDAVACCLPISLD